jgi:hypothetical protein
MIATQELVVPKSIPITFAISKAPQQRLEQNINNFDYLIIGRIVFNRIAIVFFLS